MIMYKEKGSKVRVRSNGGHVLATWVTTDSVARVLLFSCVALLFLFLCLFDAQRQSSLLSGTSLLYGGLQWPVLQFLLLHCCCCCCWRAHQHQLLLQLVLSLSDWYLDCNALLLLEAFYNIKMRAKVFVIDSLSRSWVIDEEEMEKCGWGGFWSVVAGIIWNKRRPRRGWVERSPYDNDSHMLTALSLVLSKTSAIAVLTGNGKDTKGREESHPFVFTFSSNCNLQQFLEKERKICPLGLLDAWRLRELLRAEVTCCTTLHFAIRK